MSGFAVGKLVIAVADAGETPLSAKVRSGNVGKIVAGPHGWNYMNEPMPYWNVHWASGTKSWSGQRFLLVIDDPDAMREEAAADSRILETTV